MAPNYVPGVNHGHKPSGRWSEIQDNPNSSFLINRVCKHWNPRKVVDIAIWEEFKNKPIALEHLEWYLFKGRGGDFIEDKYIEAMLSMDRGVQSAIMARVPASTAGGKFSGNFKLEQSDYDIEDFQYAFGAIDRLDFEVDYKAEVVGTLHVWFMDRYEWHPYYPGIYDVQPGDGARETNCVHAAMVELKSVGAADFWMKGEATVPLSVVKAGAARGRRSSTNSAI